ICALGDSITNGYWDDTFQGWFGRLAERISKEHPFKSGSKFGFCNCAYDGDRITDSFHRLSGEVLNREPDVLLIMIGDNDILRSPNPDSPVALTEYARREYWNRMLDLAQKSIDKIVVFGMIPHINENEICKGWYDNFYCFNKDKKEYNDFIENICRSRGIDFVNNWDNWTGDLKEFYEDNQHPNAKGHQKLADEAFAALKKLGIV
ncbi:MAG: SGNH/GDSL hydrolase family protein, partial [Rickettsiales bacterium]|nr:SGNH/GDSL hydrolase family protein [Rickettsiales bacterium]